MDTMKVTAITTKCHDWPIGGEVESIEMPEPTIRRCIRSMTKEMQPVIERDLGKPVTITVTLGIRATVLLRDWDAKPRKTKRGGE